MRDKSTQSWLSSRSSIDTNGCCTEPLRVTNIEATIAGTKPANRTDAKEHRKRPTLKNIASLTVTWVICVLMLSYITPTLQHEDVAILSSNKCTCPMTISGAHEKHWYWEKSPRNFKTENGTIEIIFEPLKFSARVSMLFERQEIPVRQRS